jgi:hypothetical protein
MPYLFQKLEHPKIKHFYIPLNRNYKPLGILGKDWVDYSSYSNSHGVAFSSDPSKISGVWLPSEIEGSLYLYEDSIQSRRDYFERFERLMARTIKIQKLS